jgi:hypothetical protein
MTSSALSLLADLAQIGATLEPVNDRLVLRAGAKAIPGTLVSRVRAAKADLLAVLTAQDESPYQRDGTGLREATSPHVPANDPTVEVFVATWINDHPAPSERGRCTWCGKSEISSGVVLPYGVEPGKRAWFHPECWPAWRQTRRAEALAALKAVLG